MRFSLAIAPPSGIARQETYPRPKDLSHAPRLSDTPTRGERFLRVEHLADRSNACVVEVRHESFERVARAVEVVRIHLQPRVDERTDEPCPHSALVVRGVARAQIAEVLRLVIR